MYVRLKSSYQVVTLSDDYLSLQKVSGDTLTFQLRYSYDQELGVKQGISSVHVEVAKASLPTTPPTMPAANLVDDIRMQRSAHVQLIRRYGQDDVLLSVASDPTKVVSNEVVGLLKRGFTAAQLPQLSKQSLVPVKAKLGQPPPPSSVQHDLGDPDSLQQLGEELLLNGVDPSSAYEVNDLGLSVTESSNGTLSKSPVVFSGLRERLRYTYKTLPHVMPLSQASAGDPGVTVEVNVAQADQLGLARRNISLRHVEVTDEIRVQVPPGADQLLLSLSVRDANGVTVQQLQRAFSAREFVKYHVIPTKPPIVKVNNQANKSHAMLSFKQVDPVATRMRVYKRSYNHFTVNDSPYTLVNEVDAKPESGWVYVPAEVSLGNTNIYRIVPVNSYGVVGTDFATAVVKPRDRSLSLKRVVLTVKPLLKGCVLEVSKLPSDCVAYHVFRVDVTTDKSKRDFVGTPLRVERSDPANVYTLDDLGVKPGHVYAYYCRLYRSSGSHEDRLVTHYEHLPLVERIVETKIVNSTLLLTDRGYDVTFSIATTVVSTKLDLVKQLLERQGMLEIFQDDITSVRDQLGKLLTHNVKRVDLTTGTVEDFGTLETTTFSDLNARNVAGVSELRSGRKYRYVVTALMRAPETLLESFVKTKVDPTTSREYSYKPFKFQHPVVSKTGSIVTAASIRANYAKDPMTFGEIGNYAETEVTLETQRSIVAGAIRENKGSGTDVLRWRLAGSTTSDVDHFQIVVEHGGKKTIVGKATCVPNAENYLFVRKREKLEVGLDLRYYVCPVYHDFTRGAEARVSNSERNE